MDNRGVIDWVLIVILALVGLPVLNGVGHGIGMSMHKEQECRKQDKMIVIRDLKFECVKKAE